MKKLRNACFQDLHSKTRRFAGFSGHYEVLYMFRSAKLLIVVTHRPTIRLGMAALVTSMLSSRVLGNGIFC
jgi:hypothetical protein